MSDSPEGLALFFILGQNNKKHPVDFMRGNFCFLGFVSNVTYLVGLVAILEGKGSLSATDRKTPVGNLVTKT